MEQATIKIMQLAALRSRVKLEVLGMKCSGRSATAIAKDLFGLKRSLKAVEVLAVLDYAMSKVDEQLAQARANKA
jgi:hypothetical protein